MKKRRQKSEKTREGMGRVRKREEGKIERNRKEHREERRGGGMEGWGEGMSSLNIKFSQTKFGLEERNKQVSMEYA